MKLAMFNRRTCSIDWHPGTNSAGKCMTRQYQAISGIALAEERRNSSQVTILSFGGGHQRMRSVMCRAIGGRGNARCQVLTSLQLIWRTGTSACHSPLAGKWDASPHASQYRLCTHRMRLGQPTPAHPHHHHHCHCFTFKGHAGL